MPTSQDPHAHAGEGTMPRRRFTALLGVALGNAAVISVLRPGSAAAEPQGNEVDNIAALRASPRPYRWEGFTSVNVLGYWTRYDGGGGVFTFDPDSTAADNGGTVIVRDEDADGVPGRWLRTWDRELSVRWFGARGDGISMDDVPVAAAFATAGTRSASTILFPQTSGSYLLTRPIVITSGQVTVQGTGPDRSVTLEQRTWGFPVFDIRSADDVTISNLTLRTDANRMVAPTTAAQQEAHIPTYNAGVFSNSHRTRLSSLTVLGFLSGACLTNITWNTMQYSNTPREDCAITDVEVHTVDFGLLAVGLTRPVITRLTGSYSKSYYNAAPHLIYWSGYDRIETRSYDVTIRDCQAWDGPEGSAYQLLGIDRGTATNLSARNCGGFGAIGNCNDVKFSNLSSVDDALTAGSSLAILSGTQLTFHDIKVSMLNPDLLTLRSQGTDITFDNVDLTVRHTTWPSQANIWINGQRNHLRNISITNTEPTGGSLGIWFAGGGGHTLDGITAVGLHKGIQVDAAVRDTTLIYDPNLITLNPNPAITGKISVLLVEPPISEIADPGVRVDRASRTVIYPTTTPVHVEAAIVTNARVEATGTISIGNTTQQAIGMALTYQLVNPTASAISVNWSAMFASPSLPTTIPPGETATITLTYQSDRRWH